MTTATDSPKPTEPTASASASKPKRRFVGSKAGPRAGTSALPIANQIPEDILHDAALNAAISALPTNYSFELHKTIHHVRKNGAKMVALQMPEGLQMFACAIADIVERFTDALTVIMGDVTYGACCIDDYTAVALGCDMMVHYGHSCLVPSDQTTIKTLYVFVEIAVDATHLVQSVRLNFPDDRRRFRESLLESEEADAAPLGQIVGSTQHLRIEGTSDGADESSDAQSSTALEKATPEPTRLALVSTIQFVAALQQLKEDLSVEYPSMEPFVPQQNLVTSSAETSVAAPAQATPKLWTGAYDAMIPRSKPLSPGEILGCTSPRLGRDVDALVYLGDGRFHLESIMISNPNVPAFRYDPYSKKLTRERYDHTLMRAVRADAVRTARKSIEPREIAGSASEGKPGVQASSPLWGVVLGTLGRQGNFKQLQAITHQMTIHRTPVAHMPILLSELAPAKLALFGSALGAFVQTSCPRLSIDWGYAFGAPLLNPYEAAVALGVPAVGDARWMRAEEHSADAAYPMEFYEAGKPWAITRAKGAF